DICNPSGISYGSNKKVWWICKLNPCGCHKWNAAINSRTNGKTGCPYCNKGGESKTCIHESLEYTHPELIKEWDFEKNKDICSPSCHNKTEGKLLQFLKTKFKVTSQKTFDWCKSSLTNKYLKFDFYLEDFDIIIELDGPQHFSQVSNWKSPEKTQNNDVYKMN